MLREVKVEVTNLCYRNCKHCSSDTTCDTGGKTFLELSLIKKIVDQACTMKASSIVFTGGEATLYPDLINAVTYAHQKGLKVKLYTMCYRDNYNIKLLKDLNEAGLDEVIYSTAAPLVVSNDLSTLSVEEFTRKLSYVTKLSIGFHHVITNQTIDNIQDLYKYIDIASDSLNKVSFLRYVPHGRGDINLIPSKEQMVSFKESLLDLRSKYGDKIRIGSPFNVLNINNTPCNAADETMIIGFDGQVYPCDAMKYFDYFGSGGSIYKKTLSQIYNSSYFKNIRKLKDCHGEECIKCQNYSICQSGCLGQKMIYATSIDSSKTLDWYEVNAKRTMNNFSSPEMMQLNAKMGIAGETGELIDCMKKLLTHDCSLEHQEAIKILMIDEIGDIIWYIASSLSSYYKISLNEVGSHLLKMPTANKKLINEDMIKHCTIQKDPDCPYNINRSYNISKIDELIIKDASKIELKSIWMELDKVAYKLRTSEDKKELITLAANLLIILGSISHKILNKSLEEVMTINIKRLQERYPMGFDAEKADARIDEEVVYKTDKTQESYIKKQ